MKILDSMCKGKCFICTVPFSLWAISMTWLHLGAPQKI